MVTKAGLTIIQTKLISGYSLSSADHDDALFNKGVAETRVVDRGSHTLFPFTHSREIEVGILGQGNVDKCNIHVPTSILVMVLLEASGRLLEPLNLVGLDPVVTGEVALVRCISMCVEEIDGQGRVICFASSKNLDVVVADTIDLGWSGYRKGVGKRLHDGHLCFARHGLLVVMVSKDGGVGDFPLNQDRQDLEHGLGNVRKATHGVEQEHSLLAHPAPCHR